MAQNYNTMTSINSTTEYNNLTEIESKISEVQDFIFHKLYINSIITEEENENLQKIFAAKADEIFKHRAFFDLKRLKTVAAV